MTASPTAASAMATPSASVPAPPSATASAALCLGTCFIHHEVSPAKILTIQRVDRAIRVFVICHFNESEPARLSRKTVANQIDARGSYTDLRKPLVQLLFRRGKRKISDIELLHPLTPSVRNLNCHSRSALKIQLSFIGGPEIGLPQARDRGFSGLLHPPGNLPLLQLKLSRRLGRSFPAQLGLLFFRSLRISDRIRPL
jgi:hypothetical protein